jgi:hypothetical protein
MLTMPASEELISFDCDDDNQDGYYVPDRVKERQWDNWLKAIKSVLAGYVYFHSPTLSHYLTCIWWVWWLIIRNPSLRVTMLEIGCGLNVPTLRFICEGIARDVGPDQATLVCNLSFFMLISNGRLLYVVVLNRSV